MNDSLLHDSLATFSVCSLFFPRFVKMCYPHPRADLILFGNIHRETLKI